MTFFLITQEVLDSWGEARVLLGTMGDKFPRFSWCPFRIVWETLTGDFINIIKLCKWSCCQRASLLSDMTNSARFLSFQFTHYPSYQKGKTVLRTTMAKEVVMEKLHWWPTQAWKATSKLTNTVKSLINGHSKKRTPLITGHIIFPRITIRKSNSYVWLSKRRSSLSNKQIKFLFPMWPLIRASNVD